MQNLDSYKPRSISRTLSVGLIISLVLVAGLSLGVNFIFSSREAKAELETRADEYTSALTDALKVPLWNYSEETIAVICASYAQNEFIAKLLVEDQKDGNKLVSESHLPHLGDGGLYISGTASLIYDAAGQVAGAIESLQDITEQKHLEKDLRRNLEELELFNQLAIGREIKMIQLKQEINELRGQLGQSEKYEIVQ
jgi:hypothetical protein